IERHEQVELALRRLVAPYDFLVGIRLLRALDAVRRAEQVLEEVLMALARRSEQVRAPDEHVPREVVRMVRVFAAHAKLPRLELLEDVVLRILFRALGFFRELERVSLQLRG